MSYLRVVPLFLFLLLACENETPKVGCASTNGPVIGAYYYAWYNPAKWQEPITNHPLRGPYVSSSPEVVKAHISDARRAGIDFFIFSWNPSLGPDIDPILTILDQEKFQYALLYESSLALNREGAAVHFNNPSSNGNLRTGDLFLSHMGKFVREIAIRPGYYREHGRPVLILYVARNFHDYVEDVSHFMTWAKSSPNRPLVIADLVYWNSPDTYGDSLKLFDGTTAYNMYGENMSAEMANYVPSVGQIFEKFATAAGRNGRIFVPNFQPGYDDRALRGNGRPIVPRNDGTQFAESFRMAARYRVGSEMMFLTSFNEWFEGTEIEGSTEYQDRYLDQLCTLKTEYAEKENALGRTARRWWRLFQSLFS